MKIGTQILFVVAALACAAPVALAGAQPHLFDALRRDATALSNPQPYLAKIDASERALLRGNTCASSNILGALANQVDAKLASSPEPDRTALAQLQADTQAALRAYPPGPCRPLPEGGLG